MSALRPEEEWARMMVGRCLEADVVQHDDGSIEGMHDLDIVYSDGSTAAAEVTAAADGDSIALWNLMNSSGRWVEPELRGGWMITLLPSARAKRIRLELPALLRQLERSGVGEVRAAASWRPAEGLLATLRDLDIVRMHQSGTDFPGSIYVTLELPIERTGGFVADNGDALANWIGEFLHDDARADVRRKLWTAGTTERHAFVILPGFATAEFAVVDVLMRDDCGLPTVDPSLPDEITHVWAVSTWRSGMGMRWSPDAGWTYFDKVLADAA